MSQLILGDNLQVMRELPSDSIDLIITDPPFNSNRNFKDFDDKWTSINLQESSVLDMYPHLRMFIDLTEKLHGKAMRLYLIFLAVRLIEMKRLLKDTGTIYLHCDDSASHYIKVCMDEIFGRRNYINEIIWLRHIGGKNMTSRKVGRVHDCIYIYSKSSDYKWHVQYIDTLDSTKFNKEDERGRYRLTVHLMQTPLTRPDHPAARPWMGFDPKSVHRQWNTPIKGLACQWIIANDIIPGWPLPGSDVYERLDALLSAHLIEFSKTGRPYFKFYQDASKGRAAESVITDISGAGNRLEFTGYATQKPVALYERFIQQSSDTGDTVLDPFMGSGTTLVAAQKLHRYYLGIDRNEDALRIARERLLLT